MRGCLKLALVAVAALIAFAPQTHAGEFYYRWVDAATGEASDYLAVIEATNGSPNYGKVVYKAVVGSLGNAPSAVGYTDDGTRVWVTGFSTNRAYIFDVETDYAKPRLIRTIDDLVEQTGFSGPLGPWPNQQVPGQMTIGFGAGSDGTGSGGIAEFTNDGEFLAAAVSTEAYLGSCCPLLLYNSKADTASAEE